MVTELEGFPFRVRLKLGHRVSPHESSRLTVNVVRVRMVKNEVFLNIFFCILKFLKMWTLATGYNSNNEMMVQIIIGW